MPTPTLVLTNSGNYMAVAGTGAPHIPRCDVCLQDGHSYKNCTHHCVPELHQHTLNVFVEYAVVSADTRQPRAARTFWTTRNRFVVTHLPLPLKRALILHYTPQEHQNYTYTSATQWRERPTDENTHIPSRVGVISRASNAFINELIFLLYDILSAQFLADHPQSAERYIQASNQFIGLLHNDINGLRLELRHASPQSTTDVTSLLIAMQDIATSRMTDYIATVEPTRPAEAAESTEVESTTINYSNYHNEDWLVHRVQDLCPAANTPPIPPATPRPLARHRHPTPSTAQIRAFATELTYTTNIDDGTPATDQEEAAPTCGICWDSLTATTACTTNCQHHFCTSCVTQQAAAAKSALIQARGYLRRNQRTPTLTCAMCRANVTSIGMAHEARDTDAALALNLVLYSTSIHGQAIPTPALPAAAPETPPPFPNIGPNDNDDPLADAFADTIALLDELNAAVATDATH